MRVDLHCSLHFLLIHLLASLAGLAVVPLYGIVIGVPKVENIDINQTMGKRSSGESSQCSFVSIASQRWLRRALCGLITALSSDQRNTIRVSIADFIFDRLRRFTFPMIVSLLFTERIC